MLTQIRKITIIVLPVVVAGVLLAFFGQPKEARTVEVAFEPQPGIEILHTTGFGCANEISLDEFNKAHPTRLLLVDPDTTSNFHLFLVANTGDSSCDKAELVSTDPTVYGQRVDGYEIDQTGGLLTIQVGSSWTNSDGVDSTGSFNPEIFRGLWAVISVLWVIGFGSAWYTNFWNLNR